MSPAERLATVLKPPGLDLSSAEEAALVWLGRLLREPRSVTRDALDELRASKRLVVRPSPLGGGLLRYTVGPAPLELDDEGLDDDARAELDDEGLDDEGAAVAVLRRGGAVVSGADPVELGRAAAAVLP